MRAPSHARDLAAGAEVIIQGSGAVRGVAVDWVSRRLYWTSAGGGAGAGPGGGGVHCAALDGRRRTTLYFRDDAEPDDIVIYNDTRQMFWTDRGSLGGVWAAGLEGAGARRVVWRRARRLTALAVLAAAARLYVLDAHGAVLESARTDGGGRATIALFAQPPDLPRSPHVYIGGEAVLATSNVTHGVMVVRTAPCARLAVWEEWVWCVSQRGVWRLPRRGGGGGARRLRAAPRPLSALALAHPAMFPTPIGGDPCEAACDASALCVRAASARAVACLCPDGLVPADTSTDKNLTCVISRSALEPGSASAAPADNTTCPLSCGAGTCAVSAGTARCTCGALYAGARCQHYRCARHCLHRGVCVLQPHPPPGTHPPPLKCICVQGYSGARCETPPPPAPPAAPAAPAGAEGCAALRCVNGAECRQPGAAPHCVCPPEYYGLRCEKCVGGPVCGADAVCSAGRCRVDSCDYCLNQGVCVSTAGGVTCACAGGWSGERCQRRACTDDACRHIAGGEGGGGRGNDVQPARGSHAESASEPGCLVVQCLHGGRCVASAGGAVCACAGAWGGAHCALYVGHDHACLAACRAPALCVWGPDLSETEAGPTHCACPLGATCPLPAPPSPSSPRDAGRAGAGAGAGAGGAWLAATLSLLTLGALVAALLYLLHRRRHGLFVHARLSDNVEISNPMYLAGEDEDPSPSPPPPRPRPAPAHRAHLPPRPLSNGGNHFANPVYESMYAPQQNMPIEEHANLLSEGPGDASPTPAERAALL